MLLTAALGAFAAVETAAVVNVNAAAPLTEAELKEAAATAAVTAQSPELQKATTNLWRNAWNASWPFIKEMFSKFFRMLGDAWNTLGKKPDLEGAAYINASVTP